MTLQNLLLAVVGVLLVWTLARSLLGKVAPERAREMVKAGRAPRGARAEGPTDRRLLRQRHALGGGRAAVAVARLQRRGRSRGHEPLGS